MDATNKAGKIVKMEQKFSMVVFLILPHVAVRVMFRFHIPGVVEYIIKKINGMIGWLIHSIKKTKTIGGLNIVHRSMHDIANIDKIGTHLAWIAQWLVSSKRRTKNRLLRNFLKSQDMSLEMQIGFEILSNLTDKPLEW
ncbi:hypothetical protein YC2023_042468 [Brassica napus]